MWLRRLRELWSVECLHRILRNPMMTFSILWVLLASTVTVIALLRRSCAANSNVLKRVVEGNFRQPGPALTVLGVIYSLVLLGGFVYIGWQHSLAFLK